MTHAATAFPDIDMNPARAALLSCAARCHKYDIREWWSPYAVPFYQLNDIVAEFAGDADMDNECSETAALFLLLVRETLESHAVPWDYANVALEHRKDFVENL